MYEKTWHKTLFSMFWANQIENYWEIVICDKRANKYENYMFIQNFILLYNQSCLNNN